MAKVLKHKLSLLLALSLFGIGSAAASHNETLVMVSDAWCPYVCEQDSAKPGIVIEVAQHVFSEMGLKAEYKSVNWARAILDVRRGRYPVLASAYREDAPDFIFPDAAIAESKVCFFVKHSDQWRYQGLSSLQDKTIGVVKDYSYGAKLDAYLKNNPQWVESVAGERALISNARKLLLGRIAVVVEDRYVFDYKTRKAGLAGKFSNAGCIDSHPVYVAFAPKLKHSKALAQKFAEVLKREENQRFLQEVLDKYLSGG